MIQANAMLDACLELYELNFFEIQFAFEGLADEHVWKRPAPELLSIGELAGHVAHAFASRVLDQCGTYPPDLSKIPVKSPLIDRRFSYYPHQLEATPSEQHLAMTAQDLYQELLRIHKEVVAHFKTLMWTWTASPREGRTGRLTGSG